MAESPAHKFGQIVGDLLEASIEPLLSGFARHHGLYLDSKGPRPARPGNKVSWTDRFGNAHDLDYVLERGGSPTQIGTPAAFIETAWRRYTKHSRNKAQEMQGAILPLAETYYDSAPFIGAILAGVFTEGAMTQLRSVGFAVLYFHYETVIAAFRRAGVDARFDEETADAALAQKVRAWEALPRTQQSLAATALLEINQQEVQGFMGSLERAVLREIELVRVLPLHGASRECASVEEAIAFIEGYRETDRSHPVVRYEVEIRYNNGDDIEGRFGDKQTAIAFLRSYRSPPRRR
jgi:hypothetical protein